MSYHNHLPAMYGDPLLSILREQAVAYLKIGLFISQKIRLVV